MTTKDRAERGLQERFAELRRADERAAASFERVLREAPPATSERAWPRLALAAVAMAAAAGGAALLWLQSPPDVVQVPPPAPSVETVELAALEWTAPTDFLLEPPGSAILTSVPELSATTLSPTFVTSEVGLPGESP